jgi:3-ketosteroid 9alpha-monooxygenase subunit B
MATVTVVTTWQGHRAEFAMDDGATVLEAARAAGVELPAMCEAGSCATCRAYLRAGTVNLLANSVLADDELATGWVLACQAVPDSAHLELDFDFM